MIKILVLCTGNSCRSQIAEGYLKLFLKGKAQVFSAGTKNHKINKYAIETMRNDGIDISTHSSNNVSEFKKIKFDYVITVCDHAKESCPAFPNSIHCNFEDPSKITENQPDAYRRLIEVLRRYALLVAAEISLNKS